MKIITWIPELTHLSAGSFYFLNPGMRTMYNDSKTINNKSIIYINICKSHLTEVVNH